VLIRDLPCKLVLHEVGNSIFEIGPFTIQSAYVIHPAPTVGYRLTYRHAVFTYIPDHEPALGEHGMIPDSKWVSGYDLAEGADVVLHDAQYTDAEYENKKGWGHSSIEDAGKFAEVSGLKHILYSHHDPFRSDEQLNEMFKAFLDKTEYKFKQELAREGMEITL
jgi:phosphoribosyl 1,2-cyclic phosphodiesterase